jgi:hypothetical protein
VNEAHVPREDQGANYQLGNLHVRPATPPVASRRICKVEVAAELRLAVAGEAGAAEPSTDRLIIRPVSPTSDEQPTSAAGSLGRQSPLQMTNRHLLGHFT